MTNYTIGGMVTGADQIAELFAPIEENTEQKSEVKEENTETTKDTQEEEQITEMDIPELFGNSSEKVGNVEDKDTDVEKKEPSKNIEGSSPNTNPYSSIAYAMFEEGVLSNLTEDDLKEVKDASSLVAAMDKYVESRFDEQQQRVLKALNAGVEKPIIQQYEANLQTLNNISEEQIEAEDTEGENLRKAIIYQYYINKGDTEDRARKMVERALSSGTDIEDAKEFLEDLKVSTRNNYDALIKTQQETIKRAKKEQEDRFNKIQKSVLEDANILGGISVNKQTRQKALDYWLKPVYKNSEGVYQSELQKYATENPDDFQIKLALLFAMSDKFKDLSKITFDTVRKEKNKAMQNLEKVINNTQRTASGMIDTNFHDSDSSFTFAPPSMWK